MFYYVIAAVVFFASFAMMIREGLWSNTITLFCIVLSGLAAFGFYQPLTVWADEKTDGSYTYLLDIVVMWGLYVAAMILLSGLATLLSTTRMRFKNPIDPVGGPVVALMAAWVMTAFTLATLHAAPLAKETMGGNLMHENVATASSISAPDLWWLRFVERMSSTDFLGGDDANKFSAAFYVKSYTDHRAKFDATDTWRVRRN